MASASCLTFLEFRDRTMLPVEMIDELEARQPGWVALQLVDVTSYVYGRLRTRYATPFVAPIPDIVMSWTARLCSVRCAIHAGIRPTDETLRLIEKDADQSMGELKEAADAKDGLWNLPLRDDADTSAASRPRVVVHTDGAPTSWIDTQLRSFQRYGR